MKKYKRQIIFEQIEDNEDKTDPKVTKALKALRDLRFASERNRKHFLQLIAILHNSSDPRARKALRLLGDHCTKIIPTIL